MRETEFSLGFRNLGKNQVFLNMLDSSYTLYFTIGDFQKVGVRINKFEFKTPILELWTVERRKFSQKFLARLNPVG